MLNLGENQGTGDAFVENWVPDELSQNAVVGKLTIETACADCYGANAVSQNGVAPSLIHKSYDENGGN